MKKIINGKKYDTDTAKAIYEYGNGLSYRDFGYCREWLYVKRTGEFFLYGEGGAASKYSKSCGLNEWTGGEDITPLTPDEAKAWAEKIEMDVDTYEKIFGEVEE